VIRVLPTVLKNIPDLKYIIAGSYEKKYCQRLQQLVEDLNLGDIVTFTGYVQPHEIPLYYNLCDVYIMPSRELENKGDTEGFGITYLEANACEKPVIGGKSGGVVDAIVDGKTGFLVNPEDEDEIADKLILLLSDPGLAQKLGKNGRDRIEKGYTWNIITKDILEKVLD
jgi:phosphatidylinositol alpha-1,6-mannosyltransferase